MTRLRGLPYAYRVLLGCLAVALIPMLIGNELEIRIFHSSMQGQAAEASLQQIAEVEQRLDGVFGACGAVADTVAHNRTISRALIDNTYGLDVEINLALYQASGSLYPGSVLSLYDVGGVRRFSTDNTTSYATLPIRWGVLRKAEEEGTVFYNVENFSGLVPPFSVHVAQSLFTEGGIRVGYVVISLPDSLFEAALSGISGRHEDILLLDRFGGTVYSSRSTVPEDELTLLRDWMLHAGQTPLELETSQYYFQVNATTGFLVALRQPTAFTRGNLQLMRHVQGLVGLASLVLCAVFASLMSRSLSRPVRRLSQAMERIKQGDLDIRVKEESTDQLGRLAADFNTMAGDLALYMEQVVRQQREMDESQIRLLQAQLNPHFLYNTLDTVKWVAKINHIPEIAAISSNLAVILRQCVSSESFITLGQELEVVRGYISIQRIRFSGRFQYIAAVPENLQDCRIPKLILQPIVENAILHGLADKEDGYVYLHAVAEEEDLLLSVTDDGCGMPPEIAEQLGRRESRIVGGHLGLYNVSHILQINYGPSYGLHAHTIRDVGTTITLRLPMQKEESKCCE